MSTSNHLEQALFITRLNKGEKGDRGDTARVLSKIADALFAMYEWEESEEVRDEAEQIYEDLINTGNYTRSSCEEDRLSTLYASSSDKVTPPEPVVEALDQTSPPMRFVL